MYNRDAVENAIWFGRRCYRMARQPQSFEVRATLYRAAAATRDAITMGEVLRNLFEPQDEGETYVDHRMLDTIRLLGDARQFQAMEYREEFGNYLPEECREAVVDAFEAAGEVYAALAPILDGLPNDWLGSILDSNTPAARAILAAFDAHNAGEDAFDAEDYYPAMMAYRSSYEAYDMAYLDIESYSGNAAETNPFLRDAENLAQMVGLLRKRQGVSISNIGRAETSAGVDANVAAVEAQEQAIRALEHAVTNLRAARLLNEEAA